MHHFFCSDLHVPRKCSVRGTGSVRRTTYIIPCGTSGYSTGHQGSQKGGVVGPSCQPPPVTCHMSRSRSRAGQGRAQIGPLYGRLRGIIVRAVSVAGTVAPTVTLSQVANPPPPPPAPK